MFREQCFLTSLGQANHRVRVATTHMAGSLVHGICAIIIGIGMLAFSEFDFITR